MSSNLYEQAAELAEPLESPSDVSMWSWRRRWIDIRQKWWTPEKRVPLLYTGSSIIWSVSQMLAGILLVRWILPQELGLWQSFYLAVPYAYFLLGGINNGLSRELPYYIGAGDDVHAKNLASTSQFVTAVGCLIAVIVGICAVAFLVLRRYDSSVILGVGIVTLLIVFNFYRNYLTVTFRSKSDFVDLSWAQVAEAILMFATLPLVYYFRYSGMLLRLVIIGALVLYIMHRIRPIRVSFKFDWESLLVLLKTGIPIFALDYLRSCAGTLDRIALLHYGGVQQVGYYAVGATAYAGFEVLPISVAHYIYPRMSYRYGQDKSALGLWGLTWKATVVLTVLMLPLAIVGWFCLPPAIVWLFPKYIAGTRAAQLMLFAAVGAGAAVGVNALWSLKAWKSMIAYQVSSSVLYGLGPFVGIRLCESPLTGVAAGVVGARCLSAIIGFGITYNAIHSPTLVSDVYKSES